MWVSSKEIAEAKQYDLISYLRLADPFELVKLSHDTYCLKSHDSFKISNGLWHWFSQSIGGRSAIDYLIKVRGYSLPDAVKEVNHTMGRDFVPEDIRTVKRKIFRLPERNSDDEEVIRYLTARGIDGELVRNLIDEGLIYESRMHHSAVFVGLDEKGIPVYASYRATAGNAKVFTVQQKDLKKFAKEAKRYGVLYSVLREKGNANPNASIDVIARASDAPKITRIVEKFSLNTVDKASVVRAMEKELDRNPIFAKTEKSPQSLRSSEKGKDIPTGKKQKTSVREELLRYREESRKRSSPIPGRGADGRSPSKKKTVKER